MSPILVAAAERLSHNLYVTDTFEAEIRPALRKMEQILDEIFTQVGGIYKVCHAEAFGDLLLPG